MATIALTTLGARNYPVRPALGTLAVGEPAGLRFARSPSLSVGQLFIVAILPGLIIVELFSAYVALANPDAGRDFAVPEASRSGKRQLLRHLVPQAVIFGIMMGLIYGGLATPTESAALGVMAAFWFVWRNRRLNWELLVNCFGQSAKTTCMMVLMIICTLFFNVTSSMTGGTQAVTRSVIGLSTTLLLLFVVFHAIMGIFMGAMSMLVVTYR